MTIRGSALALVSVTAGNYAAIAVGLATSVVAARLLGTAEFGRLALLLLTSQVMLVVVSSWTLAGLVRDGAVEHSGRGTVGRTLFARTVFAGASLVVIAVVMWLLREPLTAYLGVSAPTLWMVMAHLAASVAGQTVAGVLQAGERMALYGLSLLVERAAVLAWLLILAVAASLDAATALGAYAAGTATSAILGLGAVSGLRLIRDFRADRDALTGLWRFSLSQIPGGWAGIFGGHLIHYVIIRGSLTLSDVGLYAVAAQIGGGVQQVVVAAATVMLPRYSALAARRDEATTRRLLAEWSPWAVALYATGIGLLAFGTRPVIGVVFGEQFLPAAAPLSIILLASVAVAVFGAVNPALMAHAVVWPITAGVVASVSTNVVLALLLIPTWGIVGAALAMGVAYAVSAAIAMAVSRARLAVPPARYLLAVAPAIAGVALSELVAPPLAYAIGPIVVILISVSVLIPLRPKDRFATIGAFIR